MRAHAPFHRLLAAAYENAAHRASGATYCIDLCKEATKPRARVDLCGHNFLGLTVTSAWPLDDDIYEPRAAAFFRRIWNTRGLQSFHTYPVRVYSFCCDRIRRLGVLLF